jgi:hypothetical protein
LTRDRNGRGRFDAVIHNVGIGYREPRRVETVDGLSQLWAVNVLAPYVLTALMHKPDRLVYLTFRHAHRRRPEPGRPVRALRPRFGRFFAKRRMKLGRPEIPQLPAGESPS